MKKNYLIPVTLFVAASLFGCSKKDASPAVIQNDIAVVDNKVTSFMSTYQAPAASLAISKNGKLIYRKAYGNADNTAGEKATVNHRFRIASISKTITAVAIMKLMQEGKLTLNQKVFGAGAILGTDYGTAAYSTNVTNITVKDLLQHTSGGWNNSYPQDPCFNNPTFNPAQLITWTLDNRPLTNAPGTSYQYSNFGYMILGRIIEKLTGKTYESYIRQDILAPLGATHTELAGNTEAERKTNEVKYYGQGSEASAVYTTPIQRNDGPMGWITTPTDLLRLMTAIDSSSTRPDILTGSTLAVMRTPGSINGYYACGIIVENDPSVGSIWYHFGSIPGTQSVVLRTATGWCISFVMNTRYTNPSQAETAMANMVQSFMFDNTIPWQSIDQF